jgi:hypothetical protein
MTRALAVGVLAAGGTIAPAVVAGCLYLDLGRPPETCVDPDDLFPELEWRGTRFEVEEKAAV